MFNLSFLNISTSQIVNDLKANGYFIFEEALTEKYVQELLQEANFQQILVNTNDVGVVFAYNQKFFTHCLASSKKAYDLITCQKVLDICREYFDVNYKLTNHRIYQTNKYGHMPWHTDNNLQNGYQIIGKHNMSGILFLFYLTDVTKNAFQYVKDSHIYSRKYDGEIYLSDSYIDNNYKQDILTFPMRKGSLILCDIHGIHRAEPFKDKNYSRTSLLFQVDGVGKENVGHGEKNIVNTEYLDNLTPEVMDYLGFNFPRTYPAFPNSSVATLTPHDIFLLQQQLLPQTLNAVAKNIIKTILPDEAIINGKRFLWYLKSKRLKISEIFRK
jgi:Phytanoyl-CoA dioxygenase (PhyH)